MSNIHFYVIIEKMRQVSRTGRNFPTKFIYSLIELLRSIVNMINLHAWNRINYDYDKKIQIPIFF